MALVQFITGHNRLRRHDNLVNGGSDTDEEAFCRFCEDPTPETSEHVFSRCDRFAITRREIFGLDILHPPFDFKVYKILNFLEIAGLYKHFDPLHQLAENLQTQWKKVHGIQISNRTNSWHNFLRIDLCNAKGKLKATETDSNYQPHHLFQRLYNTGTPQILA